MNSVVRNIYNSVLAKNAVTLRLKFLFDDVRGRNRFIAHGRTVKKISNRPADATEKKKVLFPTIFYLDRGLAWQVTVAKALEVRGHDVVFMPLDVRFPRCNSLYFDDQDGFGFMTRFYNLYTNALLGGFGFSVKPYSSFGNARRFAEYRRLVERLTLDECRSFTHMGLPLGKMSLNPLIHYFRCGTLSIGRTKVVEAYKDYIAIGMVLRDVIANAYDSLKPDIVFTLNGSFLDSQIQLALAKEHGIRVVTFEAGFMLNTIMLGVNEPITDFPMSKYLPPEYAGYALTAEQNGRLDDYLKSRSQGKNNVFDYWGKPTFDHEKIRQEIGLPAGVTPDILFTNILWDSAMLDCDIAFASQIDWIFETIRFYGKHPERRLLIRIHPAEINPRNLESADKVQDYIIREFPSLPKNVIIIPPTSTISSYPLTDMSNLSLVYSSTAGLESVIMGRPTVVSGRCHYRNRGFTHDITSKEQYFSILSNPRLPMEKAAMVSEARKYAYFFFFGFMVPFDLVIERPTSAQEQVSFNFTSEEQLLPGRSKGLDFVIDVLLDRSGHPERLSKLIT